MPLVVANLWQNSVGLSKADLLLKSPEFLHDAFFLFHKGHSLPVQEFTSCYLLGKDFSNMTSSCDKDVKMLVSECTTIYQPFSPLALAEMSSWILKQLE